MRHLLIVMLVAVPFVAARGADPDAQLARLQRARRAAIAAIQDERRYPDVDHTHGGGQPGQRLVDERIAAVRSEFAPVDSRLDADSVRRERGAPGALRAFLATPPARLSAWNRAVQRRVRDRAILRRNAGVAAASRVAHGLVPRADEAEQVRLTNRYRMTLGRPALYLEP